MASDRSNASETRGLGSGAGGAISTGSGSGAMSCPFGACERCGNRSGRERDWNSVMMRCVAPSEALDPVSPFAIKLPKPLLFNGY